MLFSLPLGSVLLHLINEPGAEGGQAWRAVPLCSEVAVAVASPVTGTLGAVGAGASKSKFVKVNCTHLFPAPRSCHPTGSIKSATAVIFVLWE